MYSGNIFKNSIKLTKGSFPVTLHTFFTQIALKGYLGTQSTIKGNSKGTPWALENHLGTPSSLGHARYSATPALVASGHSKAISTFGHSRPIGTWAIRYLGTRGFEGHLRTQALEVLCLVDSLKVF